MKVIYSKTVLDRILEVKKDADTKNKGIDYILLTEIEGKELDGALGISWFSSGNAEARYRDFQERSPQFPTFASFYRSMRRTVFGVEVYVVPDRFFPE